MDGAGAGASGALCPTRTCRGSCSLAPAARGRPAPMGACASGRSAAKLALRLNSHFTGSRASASPDVAAALDGATGLIQATPAGMVKMPGIPVPERLLRPEMWVSEIVYMPLETPLLKAARRIGCPTADGGHMNVGQAVRGFKLFTGLDADAARMDAHFRRIAGTAGGA